MHHVGHLIVGIAIAIEILAALIAFPDGQRYFLAVQ
jgi:hypothetical protein